MVASVHNKTRDGVGANKAFCELIKCWAFCWKKVEQNLVRVYIWVVHFLFWRKKHIVYDVVGLKNGIRWPYVYICASDELVTLIP